MVKRVTGKAVHKGLYTGVSGFLKFPACVQVNLRERSVRTLAGDGVKAEQDYVGGRSGRAQRLNSPWDLASDPQVNSPPSIRTPAPSPHPENLQQWSEGSHMCLVCPDDSCSQMNNAAHVPLM